MPGYVHPLWSIVAIAKKGFLMSRLPSNRSGQSFVEYALMIILFAIVLLAILLILGDDLRTFINDLLQAWFPAS
jgi:Flp pilus assembly pilin Flp